jgi:hypothetical protein
MTTLPEFFQQTSDASYNRHNYELVLKSGKTVFFDDWTDVQGYWFVHQQIPDYLDFINVLDKSKRKEKVKTKGFGV